MPVLGAVVLALVSTAGLVIYCRNALRKEINGLALDLEDEEKRIEAGLYSEGQGTHELRHSTSSCVSVDSEGDEISTCTVSIDAEELEVREEPEMCALEETMRALMWAKQDREQERGVDDYESMATASQSDVRQNNLLLLSPQTAWRGGGAGAGSGRDCDSETSVSVMSNESESSCPSA